MGRLHGAAVPLCLGCICNKAPAVQTPQGAQQVTVTATARRSHGYNTTVVTPLHCDF